MYLPAAPNGKPLVVLLHGHGGSFNQSIGEALGKSTQQVWLSVAEKTGWSTNDGIDNGWYVGYVETTNNIHYFATNVEPLQDFNMDLFPGIRKELTYKALNKIGVLKKVLF